MLLMHVVLHVFDIAVVDVANLRAEGSSQRLPSVLHLVTVAACVVRTHPVPCTETQLTFKFVRGGATLQTVARDAGACRPKKSRDVLAPGR